MCDPKTLKHSSSATSSQAAVDGHSLCVLPDGQKMFAFGAEAVPANRFRVPENAPVRKTNGTSGQNSIASSASADLTRSLASKSQARTDGNGSMEYLLTWKSWAMRSGRWSCALRASARRISDSGCFGWPTPQTMDTLPAKTGEALERNQKKAGCVNLREYVFLTGWATPKEQNTWGQGNCLERFAKLQAKGHQPSDLAHQAGTTTESSSAETSTGMATQRSAVFQTLNPAFSRCLMAFPESWDHLSPGWDKWEFVQQELTAMAGSVGTGMRFASR